MVNFELAGLREERGGNEGRDRICAVQFRGDIVVSLSRGILCWEQSWVRGIRGVRRLEVADATGSCVLDFPRALRWNRPVAFLP